MTNEQLNEELARRVGWVKTIVTYSEDGLTHERIVYRNGEQTRTWNYPPNYLESRDAFWRDVMPKLMERRFFHESSHDGFLNIVRGEIDSGWDMDLLNAPLSILCKAALGCLPEPEISRER